MQKELLELRGSLSKKTELELILSSKDEDMPENLSTAVSSCTLDEVRMLLCSPAFFQALEILYLRDTSKTRLMLQGICDTKVVGDIESGLNEFLENKRIRYDLFDPESGYFFLYQYPTNQSVLKEGKPLKSWEIDYTSVREFIETRISLMQGSIRSQPLIRGRKCATLFIYPMASHEIVNKFLQRVKAEVEKGYQ